jgi:hypothetical protein
VERVEPGGELELEPATFSLLAPFLPFSLVASFRSRPLPAVAHFPLPSLAPLPTFRSYLGPSPNSGLAVTRSASSFGLAELV